MPNLQLNSLLSWHLTFLQQRTTGVAKACFALNASYKWCLSGTPVQNRIGEFFSLLRFLQVRPFASYFCKQCPCSQLQWTANKQGRCTECSHTYVSISKQPILFTLTITLGDSTISRFSTRKSSIQVSQSSRRQVYFLRQSNTRFSYGGKNDGGTQDRPAKAPSHYGPHHASTVEARAYLFHGTSAQTVSAIASHSTLLFS